MILDLYVCTYFVYDNIDEGVDEIDSLVISATDEWSATEYAEDLLQTKYPDQKTHFEIKMIDKEVYAKVFLMDLVSQNIEYNLN